MANAVFITGAQSGTGYGIAEFFAKQGWDVFITSRRGEEAVRAAKKLAELIEAKFDNAYIESYHCRGLCSFYAETGGILVGFEKDM